ncbi:MBL fold metallo-hydrolase [Hoeflea sp. YIM 152468]|uniref:MBL fold metallo-hydrolase n=1 Tax=Hoeflea sp. YIM 152468 TaxID=3031759 RepID=UPI0023D9D220|nr:MBL fold metallo-hydrolase [Hoeflea sp. YIM 152468]MDF1606994.1 MBL fold metallo-hydrolase [Hoeflea sp. YIM 152468]
MQQNRRTFLHNVTTGLIAGAAGAAFPPVGLAANSNAEISLSGRQTWSIGEISCAALFDGVVQVDSSIFTTDDAARMASVLTDAGHPEGKVNLDVNAYLLDIAGKKILIDTGTRDLYGPGLGKLPQQLAALGVAPHDITTIVLTHMHNDHTGGLTSADGAAMFANAELVVPALEWDYWTNEDNFSRAPDGFKYSFTGARAASVAYRDRVRLFTGNAETLSGIFAIALPGHSVGHSGLRIASGAEQMIIWGDAVVCPELQFAHPGWSSAFDADADQSVTSRLKIFDEAATDRILVAGMHLPFPGVGYVTRTASQYRFESIV